MLIGRLERDSSLTLPPAVVQALKLGEGDELSFAIQGDRVVVSKVRANAGAESLATFSEWASEADRRVYGGL